MVLCKKIVKRKPFYVDHPLYDCYTSRDVNGNVVGYYVAFYYIHAISDQVYVLYNTSDWYSQINLMREHGDEFVYFKQSVFVSPVFFPSIYNKIHSYVKETLPHVLDPYRDTES